MSSVPSHIRVLSIILLSIYLFIYPFALLLVALDSVPTWGTWMGGALLILQGTLMGLWLTLNYGRRGLTIALLILLLSWAVEHIGVLTGFPFGTYSYTDVLVPKILGVVPLAIPFAWLLVVPAAVGVIEYLLFRNVQTTTLTRILMAALFTLLLDITIEPVAVHINGYWVWDSGVDGYYGVPHSNFVAWWVTSVVLVWLMLWLRHAPPGADTTPGQRSAVAPPVVLPWLPPILYVLNLAMFVLVNLAHGKVTAAAIGGFILVYLVYACYLDVRRRGSKGVKRLARMQ